MLISFVFQEIIIVYLLLLHFSIIHNRQSRSGLFKLRKLRLRISESDGFKKIGLEVRIARKEF